MCQVLSVKLDEWTNEEVDTLESLGGNIVVNKKYEAHVPNSLKKPKPNSSIEDRFDFIRYGTIILVKILYEKPILF